MVSAAFRYARILKGFSFLISSRSAISEKIRAMARFSIVSLEDQASNRAGPSRLDAVVEERAPPSTSQSARSDSHGDVGRVGEAEQTTAAAGAADLRGARACRRRARR